MKKMLINLIVLFLISFNFMIYATKVASLPEVQRPYRIGIKKNKLFISDHSVLLHMYSLKDFSYKLFTSKGEGPGESKNAPIFWFNDENLFVHSFDKGMYFSYEGKFLDEIKMWLRTTYRVGSLGNNIITKNASRTVEKGHFAMEVCLYNLTEEKKLKYNKILYYFDCGEIKNSVNGKQDYPIIRDYYDFIVDNNKLFVGDTSRGFFVEIFDVEGNEAGKIRLYFDRVKIPESYKEKFFNGINKDPQIKEFKKFYNPYFPEFYPDYYRFDVEDGKVYFLTYKQINDGREVIITDFKGNILKHSSVPWSDDYSIHTNFAIMNDKYYYLRENEEAEEWELHVEEIK